MPQHPVSVIIPTYNEAQNIEPCLESVSWADEIIIVDGGSSDATLEIVKRFPSAVILAAQNAPAETQRLKGLKQIRNDWFLLLDADERVSSELRDQIQKTIRAENSSPAYYVLRKNLYRGKPIHLHHPDYQLRLFRKEMISCLPQRIHRIPQIPENTGKLDGVLQHYFFTTVYDYLAKLNKYTRTEAAYWTEEGKTLEGLNKFYYLIFRPLGRFFQYYFLKKGFLDGFFGFFFCISSAYYELAVAAHIILSTPLKENNPPKR